MVTSQPVVSEPMVSEPFPTQSTVKVSSPISNSIPLTNDYFHVPYPPPSPTTTTSTPISTPITIAPCPNVFIGVSQPHISISLTTPLYTKSTTTTSTSSPQVTVNVSDMEEGAFGVTVNLSFTQVSPLRDEDLDTIFGDDRDDFQDFHYSPFNVHQSSHDDEAPMMKGQFKVLNDKLDTLLKSSKSSSNSEYSFESHKALIETLKKENAKNLAYSTKVIENTEKIVRETAEKVEKRLSNVT